MGLVSNTLRRTYMQKLPRGVLPWLSNEIQSVSTVVEPRRVVLGHAGHDRGQGRLLICPHTSPIPCHVEILHCRVPLDL
jgi:hypothetical protein